jgi:hypothetical protein
LRDFEWVQKRASEFHSMLHCSLQICIRLDYRDFCSNHRLLFR